MVNIKDPKISILSHLRTSTTPVKGEVLATSAGISRVGIWKHIQNLQDLGYEIESARSGYRLKRDSDLPASWEIHPQGKWKILFADTTGSTMDLGRKSTSADGPTAVIAAEQSKGKSRFGKKWTSIRGGLYITLCLNPEGSFLEIPRLNAVAALSACKALETLLGCKTSLRWPNEILVEGKKKGGILVESSGTMGKLDYLAVGIGLIPGSTAFHRAHLAENLLSCFDEYWAQKESTFEQWKTAIIASLVAVTTVTVTAVTDTTGTVTSKATTKKRILLNGKKISFDRACIDDAGQLILKNKTQTTVCSFSDTLEYMQGENL